MSQRIFVRKVTSNPGNRVYRALQNAEKILARSFGKVVTIRPGIEISTATNGATVWTVR